MNRKIVYLSLGLGSVFASSSICAADIVSSFSAAPGVRIDDGGTGYNSSVNITSLPYLYPLSFTSPRHTSITANYNFSETASLAVFGINCSAVLASPFEAVTESSNGYWSFTLSQPVEYNLSFTSTKTEGTDSSEQLDFFNATTKQSIYGATTQETIPIESTGVLDGVGTYAVEEFWDLGNDQQTSATTGSGTDSFSLTFTAIPEPSSVMMLFGSAVLLLKRPMRWTKVGLSNA